MTRRKRTPTHPAAGTPRPTARIHEERSGKLPDGGHCPRCDAHYHAGRWTWTAPPATAYSKVCPACERIAEDLPAGELHVDGKFVSRHRDELIALLRSVEARERDQHPLKRIMGIVDEGTGFRVTTTDAKLADALGRALRHAYKGDLRHPPTTADRENLVRIHWLRD